MYIHRLGRASFLFRCQNLLDHYLPLQIQTQPPPHLPIHHGFLPPYRARTCWDNALDYNIAVALPSHYFATYLGRHFLGLRFYIQAISFPYLSLEEGTTRYRVTLPSPTAAGGAGWIVETFCNTRCVHYSSVGLFRHIRVNPSSNLEPVLLPPATRALCLQRQLLPCRATYHLPYPPQPPRALYLPLPQHRLTPPHRTHDAGLGSLATNDACFFFPLHRWTTPFCRAALHRHTVPALPTPPLCLLCIMPYHAARHCAGLRALLCRAAYLPYAYH